MLTLSVAPPVLIERVEEVVRQAGDYRRRFGHEIEARGVVLDKRGGGGDGDSGHAVLHILDETATARDRHGALLEHELGADNLLDWR